jgi:hypothetical protein
MEQYRISTIHEIQIFLPLKSYLFLICEIFTCMLMSPLTLKFNLEIARLTCDFNTKTKIDWNSKYKESFWEVFNHFHRLGASDVQVEFNIFNTAECGNSVNIR